MQRSAAPRIAQFVVIRGKYMPRALYRDGTDFFKNISISCTREAITRMKAIVLRYSRFSGIRIK
jgi:hypothetical protein